MRTIAITYYPSGDTSSSKQQISFDAGEAMRFACTPNTPTDRTGHSFRLVFADTPGDAPLLDQTDFDWVAANLGTFTMDAEEEATFEWPNDTMFGWLWDTTDGIVVRRIVAKVTANPRASGDAPEYPDPPIDWSDLANVPAAVDVLAGITIAANTFPARSSSGAAAAKSITDAALAILAGGVVGADLGGTGVANNAAATLTRSGNHALTITTTGTTGVTLPTSGTLVSSVTTGNGVSATNTAGALAFTLGAITPTSVNGLTISASGAASLTMTSAAAAAGNINTSASGSRAGGSITTAGASGGAGGLIDTAGGSGGAGGAIRTSGGAAAGGAITTIGDTAAGGSIDTRAIGVAAGGSINTRGSTNAGGAINTSGGSTGAGGSITTNNGGGAINTTGTGSIEFGGTATRTTLNGQAASNITVLLPATAGTLLVDDGAGNVTISGNLTVSGDTLTANTASYTVEDPLIQLGSGNAGDAVDEGWYASYTASGVKYRGMFWDASASVFRAFTGLEEAPTTTVNIAGTGYTVATIVANVTGNVSGSAGSVAVGNITGAGAGVLTALAIAVGSAGAVVVNGGDAGTPSALVGTNISGTAASLTAGVASVAVALQTARAIYGNNFDGTAALTQIIASTYGGTGNGFTKFSGPTTAERTKTLRDASDTILELGGSYTPTGTWTNLTLVTPTLGTPAGGNASNMTVDGTNSVGFRTIPQNSQSAAYTTVLADANKHLYHPAGDNNARTYTIDSNANVAYPIGTAITFVNEINTVTIAITSDTLVWLPSGSTGSRTLAAGGMATALKVTSTRWVITGVGLT